MKKILLLLVFISSVFLGSVAAQPAFAASEEISVRSDNGYEILGKIDGKIVLFRDRKTSFEALAFDEKMQTSWKKELRLVGKNVKVLTAIGAKNDFCVFYQARQKGGQSSVRACKFDANAAVKDTVTVHDFGDVSSDAVRSEIFKSEDKNLILLLTKKNNEDNIRNVTVFRIDSMKVVWQHSVVADGEIFDDPKHHTLLTNGGTAYFIFDLYNEQKKIKDHRFEILELNAATRIPTIKIIEIPQILTFDSRFSFDNANQRLVAAGLITTDKYSNRASGYFFLSASLQDLKQNIFVAEPFDATTFSLVEGKESKENKGILDINVTTLALRKDGGLLLVCEKNRHEERRINSPRTAMDRGGSYFIYDHFYDNLLLLSFNPNGSTHWKTILNKRQYSQDDDGSYSSYFLYKSPAGLRFLFNDDVKDNTTVSEYVVNTAGEFDHNSLLNTRGKRLGLRFREAVQTAANEVIIPSEYGYKLSITRFRY